MSSATPPHDSHGPDLYSGRDLQPGSGRSVDRYLLRQVLFGGAVVIVVEFATEFISALGNVATLLAQSAGGVSGYFFVQILVGLVSAVIFTIGAGLSAIFVAPLGATLGIWRLLGRVAIGGAIGTGAIVVVSLLFSLVATSPGYLLASAISSGVVVPITVGIINTALFALGVLVARSLPTSEMEKRRKESE